MPVKLELFCKHYLHRAEEGVIAKQQADAVVSQLSEINNSFPQCVFDRTDFNVVNQESYYARNTKIVENCNVLYACQINDSLGVQDAIDKAKKLRKKVILKKYYI